MIFSSLIIPQWNILIHSLQNRLNIDISAKKRCNGRLFSIVYSENRDEAYLSAIQNTSTAYTRFSGKNEDSRRQGGDQCSKSQGKGASKRLMTRRFTRASRLNDGASFTGRFSGRLRGKAILILFRPNRVGHHRLGLAISKKYAALAVVRNSIKRGVREIFRTQPIKGSALDIVVRPYRPVNKADIVSVKRELSRMWLELSQHE